MWSVRNGGEQNSLEGGLVMLPDTPWHQDEETSRNSYGDDYNHNFTTYNATYVDENIRLGGTYTYDTELLNGLSVPVQNSE